QSTCLSNSFVAACRLHRRGPVEGAQIRLLPNSYRDPHNRWTIQYRRHCPCSAPSRSSMKNLSVRLALACLFSLVTMAASGCGSDQPGTQPDAAPPKTDANPGADSGTPDGNPPDAGPPLPDVT